MSDTDLSSLLPDETLRRLTIGYAVAQTTIAQMTQQVAAKDAEHAGEVAGLNARIEGLEAQLATARADLDRMRTGGMTFRSQNGDPLDRRVAVTNGATSVETRV